MRRYEMHYMATGEMVPMTSKQINEMVEIAIEALDLTMELSHCVSSDGHNDVNVYIPEEDEEGNVHVRPVPMEELVRAWRDVQELKLLEERGL